MPLRTNRRQKLELIEYAVKAADRNSKAGQTGEVAFDGSGQTVVD